MPGMGIRTGTGMRRRNAQSATLTASERAAMSRIAAHSQLWSGLRPPSRSTSVERLRGNSCEQCEVV